MPGFAEKYAAHMVDRAEASGASQQKLDETERQAKQFKQMYNNPVINVVQVVQEPGFRSNRVRSIMLGTRVLAAYLGRAKQAGDGKQQ